jgi:hypothetical protein
MKKILWYSVVAILVAVGTNVYANPFAAHLNATKITGAEAQITFRLNENANVTVDILGPLPATTIQTTFNLGAISWGLNTVVWDGLDYSGATVANGNYTFRVNVTSSGYSEWTNVTPRIGGNEIGSAQYYYPTGVAAIRDTTSPYFGTIAVAHSSLSTSSNPGAQANRQGVYLLYNDMSWYGGSEAAAYAAAMNDPSAPWDPADVFSPWKMNLGRDGALYLGDWGTLGVTDNIYRYALGSPATALLRTGSGNHGRVITCMTYGTGTGKMLVGIDRDADGADVYPHINQWNIGYTVDNYTGDSTTLINAPATGLPGVVSAYSFRDIDIDSAGNMYITNRRWSDAQTYLFCYNIPASTLVWTMLGTDIGFVAGAYPTALALDEAKGKLYVSFDNTYINDTIYGEIAVFDTASGSRETTFFYTSITTGGSRDIAVDAVGNVLTANNADEHVRMWSPPGASSFTINYDGLFPMNLTTSAPLFKDALQNKESRFEIFE